ncbi:hypothetical protein WHP65_06425 [Campylobacter jejuni]
MKFPVKLARSIVVCAFLAGISASALSEGKEYVILKNPIANADNSLIEIFLITVLIVMIITNLIPWVKLKKNYLI